MSIRVLAGIDHLGAGSWRFTFGDPTTRWACNLATNVEDGDLVIYGTTAGVQTSWLATDVWPFWSGGLALLAFYLPYALAIQPHPALDLKLLRHPQPARALFLVCLVSIVMASTLLLIPIYVQQIQGESPLVAGLVLLPQGLVMGLGVLLGNALTRRWPDALVPRAAFTRPAV